jgi:hypothetical protein
MAIRVPMGLPEEVLPVPRTTPDAFVAQVCLSGRFA